MTTANTEVVRKLGRTCYVHIGTHKTGTTSIQVFLGANRARFATAGVVFPLADAKGTADVTHHMLARELKAGQASDSGHGQLIDLKTELSKSSARVACLSSEDLAFLWNDPTALVRLRKTILDAGFTPRIVVYLRPQASYCAAVYAEMVRQGYLVRFADYFADVIECGNYIWGGGSGPPFDYDRLLGGFAAIFGTDAIVARRYQAGSRAQDLCFEFARLLLPVGTDFADFNVSTTRENGSLDFASVLRMLGAPQEEFTQRIRFSPLSLLQILQLWLRFQTANKHVAAQYDVVVPVFDARDMAFALPIRRTPAKVRTLAIARRKLAMVGQQRPIFTMS